MSASARDALASIDVEFYHNGEVYAFDLGSDNAAVALAALSAAGFVVVPREPKEYRAGSVSREEYERARAALMARTTDQVSAESGTVEWTPIYADPARAVALLNALDRAMLSAAEGKK